MLRSVIVLTAGVLLAAFAVGAAGCGDGSARERPEGPVRIVVSIPPLAWAVRELAPAGARVEVLLKDGQSEHGTSLTASDAESIRNADFVFLVGWGLEPGAERLLDDRPEWQRVVRMSETIAESELEPVTSSVPCNDPSHNHDHGDGHHHATDPHAWLDPLAMAEWVRAVGETLGADAADIDALVSDCERIDEQYESGLSAVEQRHIVTHHNAYGWIARRYDLEVAAVIRPNELLETTPGELNAAVEAVRSLRIGAVFIEPQFSGRAANRLRDITGVRLLRLDPLGDGDWPGMMRANLASLIDGLSAPAPDPQPVPSGQ